MGERDEEKMRERESERDKERRGRAGGRPDCGRRWCRISDAGGGVASVMPAVGRKEKKWLWKENREKERKKEKRKDGEEEGRNGCLDGEKMRENEEKRRGGWR